MIEPITNIPSPNLIESDFGYLPGRISVIIPTYNYAHFLIDAVQSVLSQPVTDLEVIVVDDGSTDDTVVVLNLFKSRINYIHQDNCGLSAARNTGIAASTGEYIEFLDADDNEQLRRQFG